MSKIVEINNLLDNVEYELRKYLVDCMISLLNENNDLLNFLIENQSKIFLGYDCGRRDLKVILGGEENLKDRYNNSTEKNDLIRSYESTLNNYFDVVLNQNDSLNNLLKTIYKNKNTVLFYSYKNDFDFFMSKFSEKYNVDKTKEVLGLLKESGIKKGVSI